MKRALTLILVITACFIGFLSIRGTMPFMAIFGTSMEPEIHPGDLILIKEVAPSQIKVGDVIVFIIPPMVRDAYNYPPTVAHRVIKVNTEYGITFRTKGDNTGEDPFTVRAQDLKGVVSKQIPYAGFPLLFLQSKQGLIFVIVALSLLAIYLYGGEMNLGRRKLQRGIFAPVIEASYHSNRVLAQKIDTPEQRMDSTQQALEKFAAAIEVYAEHLSSHTSAIQGLSEASHELKRGAATQNQVLIRLMETMDQPRRGKEEITPEAEQATPEPEKTIPEPEEKTIPEPEKTQYPPGCVRSRQAPEVNSILEKLINLGFKCKQLLPPPLSDYAHQRR